MPDPSRTGRCFLGIAAAVSGLAGPAAWAEELPAASDAFQPPPLTLTNAAYTVKEPHGLGLRVPSSPDGLPVIDRALALAAKLIQEEAYRDAMRLVDAVLRSRPDEQRALIMRSALLTHLGRYAEALALLERLIQEDPDSVAIKNNAAWIYATAEDPRLRDGRRAVALAKEALLLAPRSYHVWSTMSEGYYVSGQFGKALSFAQEAHRMAVQAGASAANLREYRDQIRKNQAALHAFRLIE